MDVAMPDLNGIEVTRQIISEMPHVKVIAPSMYADRLFVVNMLMAGACGYLLKDCAYEELVQAIRAALAHKTYLSPGIADLVVQKYLKGALSPEPSVYSRLSHREREVLQLMSEGKSTNQIADCLHLSIKTVETHRQQVMQKMNRYSVAELTKYAIREGLTTLES